VLTVEKIKKLMSQCRDTFMSCTKEKSYSCLRPRQVEIGLLQSLVLLRFYIIQDVAAISHPVSSSTFAIRSSLTMLSAFLVASSSLFSAMRLSTSFPIPKNNYIMRAGQRKVERQKATSHETRLYNAVQDYKSDWRPKYQALLQNWQAPLIFNLLHAKPLLVKFSRIIKHHPIAPELSINSALPK
jgi:hypothetical protein